MRTLRGQTRSISQRRRGIGIAHVVASDVPDDIVLTWSCYGPLECAKQTVPRAKLRAVMVDMHNVQGGSIRIVTVSEDDVKLAACKLNSLKSTKFVTWN